MASGTLNSVTRSEGCYVWKLIWEMWKRNQVANRVCRQRFYRKSLLIRYTLCSALILSKRCPLSNNFFGLAISQRNNCCHQRYILLSVLSNYTHILFLGGWRGGLNNNLKRGYERDWRIFLCALLRELSGKHQDRSQLIFLNSSHDTTFLKRTNLLCVVEGFHLYLSIRNHHDDREWLRGIDTLQV